ncbi:MAG: DUF1961 family protein [Blastocatellia bacterium]
MKKWKIVLVVVLAVGANNYSLSTGQAVTRRNGPKLVWPASEKFVPTDVDFAHPIYETSFDDPAVLKDWKLEGGKQMSVAGGNLALESGGRNNHLVCWLRKEAPADFLLEFTFRPQHRQEGLAIVFFNARGLKGESIFDQALAPRDGTFDQYHSGDLNNYHISYWAAGRETAHIRKNKGFQLVAQGQDLVAPAPADAFQTIRVYKRGGKIRLIVDNMVAVADDDDGQTYGPVHTHAGWIGLRQMGHAVRGEYGHLKLFPLTAASAKDESRQAPAATT